MNRFFLSLFLWGLTVFLPVLASPISEAPTDLKGFFGESLADDIYCAAGRKLIPYKMNPNRHGPDRIYRLSNGLIEVHEIKAYSDWAGKGAMRSSAAGSATYELSDRWCRNWIEGVLSSPASSDSEKSAARILADAIRNGKARYVYDEFNLTTRQFRASNVLQSGVDDVVLSEKLGPMNLKRFDNLFSRKSKDFLRLKMYHFEKLMTSPKVSSSAMPLARKDQLALLPPQAYRKTKKIKQIEIHHGLMTSDGKLLVALKSGFSDGVMVFAFESGHAVYEYAKGNILKPELDRKIQDAAVKGSFVGTCVGVTVFLGASPVGWCVLGVSIGSYMIVDTALEYWHEYQDSKYLTEDDLRAWGITVDSVLEPNSDSILDPAPDTILSPRLDTILP